MAAPEETHDAVIHEEHHDASESRVTRVVVISVDQSAHSHYAFQWALDNFIRPETDLVVLVNVRPVATIPGPYGASYVDFTDYLAQVEEQHRSVSHQLLQSYAGKIKQRKISCKAIAMRGDPRDEITRKCTELSADALIVGSRGMGAVKRTLLGSVSDHLVHHVPCPTIIVKTPADWQPPAEAK